MFLEQRVNIHGKRGCRSNFSSRQQRENKTSEDNIGIPEQRFPAQEAENDARSWTFDDPRYWDQHYNKTNANSTYEWYLGALEPLASVDAVHDARPWPNVILDGEGTGFFGWGIALYLSPPP